MGAQKYNYNFDEFFYGEVCEVESHSGVTSKEGRNDSYNIVEVNFDGNDDSLIDTSAIQQDISLVSASASENVILFGFRFTERNRKRFNAAVKKLGLKQQEAADLLNVSHRTLCGYLTDEGPKPKGVNLEKTEAFLKLYSLLEDNIALSYVLNSILLKEHDVFGGHTAVEYSKSEGDRGVFAILGVFKRIYE